MAKKRSRAPNRRNASGKGAKRMGKKGRRGCRSTAFLSIISSVSLPVTNGVFHDRHDHLDDDRLGHQRLNYRLNDGQQPVSDLSNPGFRATRKRQNSEGNNDRKESAENLQNTEAENVENLRDRDENVGENRDAASTLLQARLASTSSRQPQKLPFSFTKHSKGTKPEIPEGKELQIAEESKAKTGGCEGADCSQDTQTESTTGCAGAECSQDKAEAPVDVSSDVHRKNKSTALGITTATAKCSQWQCSEKNIPDVDKDSPLTFADLKNSAKFSDQKYIIETKCRYWLFTEEWCKHFLDVELDARQGRGDDAPIGCCEWRMMIYRIWLASKSYSTLTRKLDRGLEWYQIYYRYYDSEKNRYYAVRRCPRIDKCSFCFGDDRNEGYHYEYPR